MISAVFNCSFVKSPYFPYNLFMQQTDGTKLIRRKRSLQYLALVCVGAALLTRIQLSIALAEWLWDIIWLFYLLLAELIGEPLTRDFKFGKRVGVGGVLLLLWVGLFLGLRQLGRYFGIHEIDLVPLIWLVIGAIFYLWGMTIHPDSLGNG